MALQQEINLQWNDHITYLTKMLSFQRSEEHFCDICLVSEDGFIFKAHRVVLSMISGYFNRILSCLHPNEYPTVVLDGINHQELTHLLNYMYDGVAQVNQNCIDAILKAADDLEIKGLSKIRSNTSIRQLISTNKSDSSENAETQSSSPNKIPAMTRKDNKDSDAVTSITKISLQNSSTKHSESGDSYVDQTRGMDLSLSRGQPMNNDNRASIMADQYKRENLRLNNGAELYVDNDTQMKRNCELLNNDSVTKESNLLGENSTLTYCNENLDDNSIQIHGTNFSPASGDSVVEPSYKKHAPVEVCCSDGAVTISVAPRVPSTVKREKSFRGGCGSGRFRKTKKELEEEKRKWLAKERKNLFSNTVMKYCKIKSLQKGRSLYVTDCEKIDSKISANPSKTNSPTTKYNKDNNITINFNLAKDSKQKVSQEKGKAVYQFPTINPLKLFTLPKMKNKVKQTRTSLTVGEKIKVIEAFLDGKSQRKIAHMCGIGKTQVCGIIKSREKILRLYHESILRGEKATLKRKRVSEYASLNEHLLQWHRHMTLVIGVKISTGMLRAKALEIASELGYKDFKASNGWLATFKAKNNLKLSRTKVNAASFSNDSEEDDDEESNRQQDEYYDEEDGVESDVETSQVSNMASSNNLVSDVPLHLAPIRSDIHDSSQILSSGLAVQNSSIVPTAAVGKNSQMNNMSLCSNIAAAYNLTRDHNRTEIAPTRADINIGEIHPPTGPINPVIPLSHPSIQKADGSLSYKSEETVSYGYDHQGRMNENNTRGTEYNYSHYGFPSAYYGYHFLGQY